MRFLGPNPDDETIGVAFLSVEKHVEERLQAVIAEIIQRIESRAVANVSGGVVQTRSGDLLRSLQSKVWTRPGVKVGGLVASRERTALHGRFLEIGFKHTGKNGARIEKRFLRPALDGVRGDVRARLSEVVRMAAGEA